jgi:serine/threonine protein kinase
MNDDTRSDSRGEPEPPWPRFALPRGTVVNGYRIDRVLGSGGFGITYLALDLLRQRFAIKEYYPQQFAVREHMTVRPITTADAAMFDDCRERFLREAQALVMLGSAAGASEGIVHVQTYFEAFGTCFLVMDYLEGDSLANVFRQEPDGLAPARVRSLLTQLLSSIRIVHQAGLVHRDIKPANVIVREGDRLVLIDFGAIRQATPTETTSFTQIYSGGYGPPEQMLGHRQGEFSDIYAIGAVCYRAIGGRVANALARQNSLAAGLTDPQPSAASFGAGRYPPSLLAAIDAALKVDPAQRPQSADAMLEMLGSDTPADVPPVAVPGARRGTWLAAAGLGALALTGAAYLMLRSPTAPPPSPVSPPSQTASAPPEPTPPPPPPATIVVPPPQPAAIVVPPPTPAPVMPSPFEQAQSAAAALPCAAVHLTASGDGVRATGFAASALEFDRFLSDLSGLGRVANDVAWVDRAACRMLEAMAPVVRGTWQGTPPALVLRLDQPNVSIGARLGISVTSAIPVLYVDLYQADGMVRHLLRPSEPGAADRRTVDWVATSPPGTRLIVAIGADAPLDLGQRPEAERDADYLSVLRPHLQDATRPLAADLAMVIVRAAEPPPPRPPQPRQPTVRPAKCANILSRAQLGETLSDAELTALRTECRS